MTEHENTTLTTRGAAPLKVLLVHNTYQQRGGEDAVVDAEETLLRDRGHEVLRYQRSNSEIGSGTSGLNLLRDTIWSPRTSQDAANLIESFRPDVMHVHNSFPLVSPSVYWSAHRAGVPVVQTLHNYRLVCPQSFLLRDESPCTDCVGHIPWRAVLHRCYRNSAAQSAALALMLQSHRTLGTWRDRIELYIVLNEFCRQHFVRGGIPVEKLRLKPNFTRAPKPPLTTTQRDGLLFVGRLSPEKGVDILREAWSRCDRLPLRVIGDGPLRESLNNQPGLRVDGPQPADAVALAMQSARALVVPSVWPEMFGMVVIEAFAAGLPVIASRIGALTELIEDGVTGWLVKPGDPGELAARMHWAQLNPQAMAAMGAAAYERWRQRYTPEANAALLEDLYRDAMQAHRTD